VLGTLWGQTKLSFHFRGHLDGFALTTRGLGHEEGRAWGAFLGLVEQVSCVVYFECTAWLGKASEVDSGQTLHVYIVKHDPFGPAKVVVGVSIALHTMILALS